MQTPERPTVRVHAAHREGTNTMAQPIYCRGIEDSFCCAGPSAVLTRHGRPFIITTRMDRSPPHRKNISRQGAEIFQRPDQPTLGDLAFTEAVMFDR